MAAEGYCASPASSAPRQQLCGFPFPLTLSYFWLLLTLSHVTVSAYMIQALMQCAGPPPDTLAP